MAAEHRVRAKAGKGATSLASLPLSFFEDAMTDCELSGIAERRTINPVLCVQHDRDRLLEEVIWLREGYKAILRGTDPAKHGPVDCMKLDNVRTLARSILGLPE